MDFLPSVLRPSGRDRVYNVEDGMTGTTLHHPPSAPPGLHESRRATMVGLEPSNQLATFRHLVGIHSTKEFVPVNANQKAGFLAEISHNHNNLHFDGRAAPNLGIYNRVCHREKQAKRGYKFASVLINSCLGVQIIVAAALTAMGAANSNHVSITAFGAINTVIAGLLTYLKGSGLPNRIRWYENEWKKVREYIEQRERDFGRPDCRLDVNEVVTVIEAMYEEVKADIQTNTPEMYINISDIRARSAAATNPQIPKLHDVIGHSTGGADGKHRSKLEELEVKYGHKVTDFLESLAHKEEERLKRIENDVQISKSQTLGSLEKERDTRINQAMDWEKEVTNKVTHAADEKMKDIETNVALGGRDLAEQLEGAKQTVLRDGELISRKVENAQSQVERKEKELESKLQAAAMAKGRLECEIEELRKAAHAAGEVLQQTNKDVHTA